MVISFVKQKKCYTSTSCTGENKIELREKFKASSFAWIELLHPARVVCRWDEKEESFVLVYNAKQTKTNIFIWKAQDWDRMEEPQLEEEHRRSSEREEKELRPCPQS